MKKKINKAIEFAKLKHKGQYRIGGKEYITHPLEVFNIVKGMGYDEDYQLCALFHDLLEDTDATEEEILTLSNQKVLEAVKVLTKTDGYDMNEYVRKIKENKIAYVVKGADRLHNLRSAIVASEEFKTRYIEETLKWYVDFNDLILNALNDLISTLK